MGKQWKQWETLFFGLQNHCRWWLQPWNEKTLAPWKKSYVKPKQRFKKQRHHFSNKGPYKSKLCFFPVVMYGCESWTTKKAECRRIDAFELWCWRRLLRVPWTARRSNQSILKEINPEYSLEGLMLKLKNQYFGYLMWRADSLEKTLSLGKTDDRRRRGWEDVMVGQHYWLYGHEFEKIQGIGDGEGGLACCDSWGHEESDTTERLNWTELT